MQPVVKPMFFSGWTIHPSASLYQKNVIALTQGEPIFVEEFLFFNGN
jgi:hypothetical protein